MDYRPINFIFIASLLLWAHLEHAPVPWYVWFGLIFPLLVVIAFNGLDRWKKL